MTNSLLTNMERLEDTVILIGATNRMEVLDSAFLRRFDAKIELPTPTEVERKRFADQTLLYHELPIAAYLSYGFDKLTQLSSFSEIKTKIMELGRQYLLSISAMKNEM